jgi:hypothetical protein
MTTFVIRLLTGRVEEHLDIVKHVLRRGSTLGLGGSLFLKDD